MIRKSILTKPFITISSVVFLLSLAACGQVVIETTDTKEKPADNEHLVVINELSFAPEEIKIKIGDTVTWLNQDSESHTVTSWYSWSDENRMRRTLIGHKWDSGDIELGESYSRTFDNLGNYDYISLPLYHYEFLNPGLMGVVVVE